MNTKNSLRLGRPLNEAARRATDFMARFVLGDGKSRLHAEVAAVVAQAGVEVLLKMIRTQVEGGTKRGDLNAPLSDDDSLQSLSENQNGWPRPVVTAIKANYFERQFMLHPQGANSRY